MGAPQYFEKESEIGGAVYVYINNQGMWDNVKPTRIDGPQDSMFGLAVANLGDINQDGYHGNATGFELLSAAPFGSLILFASWLSDFAVGAPNDDGGAGKVFIYHGSKTGLQSEKAGQVWTKTAEHLPLLESVQKASPSRSRFCPPCPVSRCSATLWQATWTWTRTPTRTLPWDPSPMLCLCTGERAGAFFPPLLSHPVESTTQQPLSPPGPVPSLTSRRRSSSRRRKSTSPKRTAATHSGTIVHQLEFYLLLPEQCLTVDNLSQSECDGLLQLHREPQELLSTSE